jgi:hypothetical protein
MRLPVIIAALFGVLFASVASAQTDEAAAIAAAGQLRDAYWGALNLQHYDVAYAMYASSTQAVVSRDAFVEYEQQGRRDNGAVIERRVMRTTVYDNPANAPAPGLYVAFDFIGRYEATDRACGYLILHRLTPSAPFRVVRSEQAFLDNATAARVQEQGQSVDEFWAQMATQYCPGWQSDWQIQPPA